MILDMCFSEVGRSTDQHLNNLRRQLGTGVDPAYDYSSMLEMQKKLAQAGKKPTKERADRQQAESSSSGPASGLDLLKRTLREVVGVGAGVEDEEEEEEVGNHKRTRSTPADIREQRYQSRNSHAFLSSSREDLSRLNVENRFRAPPIGSYRPKETHLLSKIPRLQCHEFGRLGKTKSLKVVAVEKEIERRQEEGKPYDDLVKHGVTIELQEGIPSKPKPKYPVRQFEKDLPRPDMTTVANIQYHDNSFTAGLADGDLCTSKFRNNPSWDFAKTSTAPQKDREYYFQPGQYAVKFDSSKPKQELKNISFNKQQNRKPLSDSAPAGLHLPDRSLARPSAMGSCPLLERRVRGFNIKEFTNRKPIYDERAPDYDSSDPKIEESVLANFNKFDAFEAIKPTRPGPKPVDSFKNGLTRLQHHRTMRSYGNDQCLVLAQTNLTRGPTSSDLLPMDSMHEKPSLTRRVVVKDLRTMQGREISKEYQELPPRGKDMSNAMFFEREARSGDGRPLRSKFQTNEQTAWPPLSRAYEEVKQWPPAS